MRKSCFGAYNARHTSRQQCFGGSLWRVGKYMVGIVRESSVGEFYERSVTSEAAAKFCHRAFWGLALARRQCEYVTAVCVISTPTALGASTYESYTGSLVFDGGQHRSWMLCPCPRIVYESGSKQIQNTARVVCVRRLFITGI